MIWIAMDMKGIEEEEDGELIQELFLENERAMYMTALKIVKEEHTARDMVATACVKMITKIEKIRKVESRKRTAYIISIVRNASLMYLRKRRRENVWLVENENVFDWATHEHHDVDEELIAEAEIGELREGLKRIHRKERELLEMKHFEGLTDEEIAVQLRIGKNSVRQYMTNARRSLRRAMEEREKDE